MKRPSAETSSEELTDGDTMEGEEESEEEERVPPSDEEDVGEDE